MSVWITEVGIALKKLVEATVTCPNKDFIPVSVKCIPTYPEKGVFDSKLPIVSFFSYNQRFDINRYDPSDVKVVNNGVIHYEKQALPYNLSYQIDFWSEYASDRDFMTLKWLSKVPKRSLLEVVDNKGVTRYCNMFMQSSKSSEEKDTLSPKTIFRQTYTYFIYVEIDENEVVDKNLLQTLDIINNNKKLKGV